MGQTVYVDLFFMINFSMDFLCFFLTSQILGSKLKVLRTVLAAVLGGIYANLSLFLDVGGIWALVIDISVCALMCLVAFGKNGSLTVHIPVYIAVSMTLGGFMTALFALLNRADLPLEGAQSDGISAWALVILAVISAGLTLAGGRFFRRKSAKKYAKVRIHMYGRQKTLDAFCDSGNLLRDPISGKICVLANSRSLGEMIPRSIGELTENADMTKLCDMDADIAKRVRLIPAKTAFGDGMLVAVRADKIVVGDGNSEREVDALLALCDSGKFGEGCDALLPSELLI
ncbi:MAG: sigma-E processing peptidase SpoIIGA [Clostridia bacterium]|nr:sigma-E processing peptidase SpoIIGA [Clostridia bacterium]